MLTVGWLQVSSSFWNPGKRKSLYLAPVFLVAEENEQNKFMQWLPKLLLRYDLYHVSSSIDFGQVPWPSLMSMERRKYSSHR